MERFDVVVIGGGPGGYHAAIRAAQLGLRTALVEKRRSLGGTCLNVGCIPSKALLESSELYSVARKKMANHGIQLTGVSLDLATMMKRKSDVVSELVAGLDFLMEKNKISRFHGFGSLQDARSVKVTSARGEPVTLSADSVILASGSAPVELPFLKFDRKSIVSSTEALSFDKVPQRLVVIGAGAIGLEMGSVWNRLGSEVTVIELLPRIAPLADRDASSALHRVLRRQGLKFLLEHRVTGAEAIETGVRVSYSDKKNQASTVDADKLLVAVGRRPYTRGLGLENVGIELGKGGFIPVDHHWQTSVKGIYAIGDLIEGPMLAHKAQDEGVALAEQLAGKSGHVNYDAMPNVIYTHPELAEVGLSEQAARDRGFEVQIGKFAFRSNGRAKTLDDTDGMVKLVCDKQSDRLLGAHIVGPRASDLLPELVLALEFGASSEDVARTIHAHPTLAEVVKEAALSVDGRPIHG